MISIRHGNYLIWEKIISFVDLNNLYLLCCENPSINNIKLKNEIMRYIRLTLIKDKTDLTSYTMC